MSLVNDMLRDLAGQQSGPNMPADEHKQWLADSSLARRPKRVWLPSLLVFVAVLILLVLLQRLFLVPDETQSANEIESDTGLESVANVVAPVVENQPAPVEQTRIAQQEIDLETKIETQTEVQAETNDEAKTEQPNTEQQVIDAWLTLANQALIQDRLTAPLSSSAYQYYQQVLTVAPQHQQALLGLENIVARYLELVREAAQENEFVRAQTLLRRAKLVIADHPAVSVLEAQLAEQQAARSLDSNTANKVSLAPAQTESYSLPAQLPLESSMQVAPNRAWQDQQTAAQARALMQQGQVQAARLQLEVFLQQQGSANISSQLLCTLYLEQGDLLAAAKLLAGPHADSWPANDRVRLRAQLLMVQGETQNALTLLESNLDNAENDERYRALLASLYQASGNYHEAVASYRRLLSVFGEKSAYWLGLALALDALEQNASAVESYRRAQSFQNLQAEVSTYIEQRITALSR